MIYSRNLLVLFALVLGFALLYAGCASTEEVVEEEPEPDVVEEAEPPPPPPPPPEPEPEPEPVAIPELENVYFGFDLSNIDSRAAGILDRHVEALLDLPSEYRVSVDAYTDHVGGDQYNLRLSYRRANAVVQYLTENGVTEDRIESRGLGKAPVPCYEQYTDDPGCPDNRRAEFEVIEQMRAPRRNN
ncbi:MAG: OmpA family protein [Balneolales bacterium]